jgi:hypothetical protein
VVDAWWERLLTQPDAAYGHALAPLIPLDHERREEGRRAFNLGRDFERRELGLPPKFSDSLIEEPPDLHAVLLPKHDRLRAARGEVAS